PPAVREPRKADDDRPAHVVAVRQGDRDGSPRNAGRRWHARPRRPGVRAVRDQDDQTGGLNVAQPGTTESGAIATSTGRVLSPRTQRTSIVVAGFGQNI